MGNTFHKVRSSMLQKQDKSLKEKRSVEHGSHNNLRINLDKLIRVCSP